MIACAAACAAALAVGMAGIRPPSAPRQSVDAGARSTVSTPRSGPAAATSSTPASPPAAERGSPLDAIATVKREPAPARQPTVTVAPRASIEPPAPDRWLVVSVHDGDTVNCVDHDKVQCKVRLVGIDAPEIGQPFGTVSRDRLRALVLRKSVTIQDAGKDRYGRTLGTLEIDGQDVNRQMVRDGLAWHYTRYSDDAGLAAAEREARAAGRGLWRDPQPVPPWEWRAGERERRPAVR